MLYFKNNKTCLRTKHRKAGFTLVELMIVVVIVGILVLLGVRLYSIQEQKAMNAIVKANAATVQTFIMSNMIDKNYNQTSGTDRSAAAVSDIVSAGNFHCQNPYTGSTTTQCTSSESGVIYDDATNLNDHHTIDNKYRGAVAVASPKKNYFEIQGLDRYGYRFGNILIAQE